MTFKRPRRRFLAAAVLAVGGFGIFASQVWSLAQTGDTDDNSIAANEASVSQDASAGYWTLAAEQNFSSYRALDAGQSFQGLSVTGRIRRLDSSDDNPRATDFVSTIYGTCDPTATEVSTEDPMAGGECYPPLEIQTWPACIRNPAIYPSELTGNRETLTVRGVSAYFYEEDTRLELSTGDITVIIFGDDRTQILAAAGALGAVNASSFGAGTTSNGNLVQPVPGAVDDQLACGTAPTNTVLPVISGAAQTGATLTGTAGSWSAGTGSVSYAYQWQRCGYRGNVLEYRPVAYWRLSEASGMGAADAGGYTNNATVHGAALGVAGALVGDPDTAASFDGVNDYASAPDSAALQVADTFTLEAWVRRQTVGTTDQILQKGAHGYALRLGADNLVYLAKSLDGDVASSTTSIVADGAFHHLVATKDGPAVHIYVDGADVTGPVTNVPIDETASSLQIGRVVTLSGTGSSYFHGVLDEVAVYDTVLEPEAVETHYTAGRSSNACSDIDSAWDPKYTLGAKDLGTTIRLVVRATTMAGGGDAVSSMTARIAGAPPVNTSSAVISGTPAVGQSLAITPGAWSLDASIQYSYEWQRCGYTTFVLADTPAGYWRLGELSGTSASDQSGNGQTGTYTNGVTLGVPGALLGDTNTGARFDGANDYISVPDDPTLDLGDTLTIEEWVKRNVAGVKGQIVQKGVGGYAVRIDTDDKVHFAKSNIGDIVTSTVTIPVDGTFHHVVVMKNGSEAHIYVDAVDVTGTVTNQVIADTTANLQIGRFYSGTSGANHLNGDLDEVALYNVLLTQATLVTHYNAGISTQCVTIPNATAATYTVQAVDRESRIRVVERATNAAGSNIKASARTAVVQ